MVLWRPVALGKRDANLVSQEWVGRGGSNLLEAKGERGWSWGFAEGRPEM